MYEETKRSKVVKYILIGIALLFVFVMLVLPLVTVICEAFKSGAEVFRQAVSDDYTVKAIVPPGQLQSSDSRAKNFLQHLSTSP